MSVTERGFAATSRVDDAGMALALAPALTPTGPQRAPEFFRGFATRPQVLARALVTLADITAMRYFQYTPTTQRDPVLSAHGDRLRAECFSACNSVYARLDVFGDGLDGGEIGFGTTNVDITADTRRMLSGVGHTELLHLQVGDAGLTAATPEAQSQERPVRMPTRWVPALGNVAELHRGTSPGFTLDAARARAFIGSLPPATASGRSGWLTPTSTGARLAARPSTGAVRIAGLHRLSALRRMLPHVRGAAFHGGAETGVAVVEIDLPGARITLGLTEEPWRGHSGEGSLLIGLATPDALDDADLVAAMLAFEPCIDVTRLQADTALPEARVRSALAVLAASGRVGWDVHDRAHFHRELPDDPARVTRDNPRLVAARRLLASDAVRRDGAGWRVRSGDGDYLVAVDPASCTCTWHLTHGTGRGPCKHLLAVLLAEGRIDEENDTNDD